MVNSICPGLIFFKPSFFGISFCFVGKIVDMRTIFVQAIPASLSAYSKLVSLSSWMPIPRVRNNSFATKSSIARMIFLKDLYFDFGQRVKNFLTVRRDIDFSHHIMDYSILVYDKGAPFCKTCNICSSVFLTSLLFCVT